VINNTGVVKVNKSIAPGLPLYLRVKREGDQWTESYSYNGTTWTTAGSFTQAMTVSRVGALAGNSGSPAPAFTALVDYFQVTGASSGGDTTAPVISNVQVTGLSETGATGLDTELAYQRKIAKTTKDPYLMALAAATMANLDPSSAATTAALDKLAAMRKESGVYAGADHSITRSGGDGTTTLADSTTRESTTTTGRR